MTSSARRRPSATAGLAAVHHLATSAAILAAVAGWAAVSYLSGRAVEFLIAAALGSLLCIESLRAEFVGRPFPTCPLCTRTSRGTCKESDQ
ncbi:hypothetical protein [Streptomyces sp. NPDC007369]|uniref:hypothetical protein n=1 Tax=Streptomyces sp. NPDC007369 TaxID=3154589 RepID=UPI0033C69F4D